MADNYLDIAYISSGYLDQQGPKAQLEKLTHSFKHFDSGDKALSGLESTLAKVIVIDPLLVNRGNSNENSQESRAGALDLIKKLRSDRSTNENSHIVVSDFWSSNDNIVSRDTYLEAGADKAYFDVGYDRMTRDIKEKLNSEDDIKGVN